MAKRKQAELIRGSATHRRTEGDYMGVLLDAVTLDDWRSVMASALRDAKSGDPQARNWLAQYLIGRPEGKAPTPLTVDVNQSNGADPVVSRLANPLIHQQKYSSMHADDVMEQHMRAMVVAKLQQKVSTPETLENLASAWVAGPNRADSGGGDC